MTRLATGSAPGRQHAEHGRLAVCGGRGTAVDRPTARSSVSAYRFWLAVIIGFAISRSGGERYCHERRAFGRTLPAGRSSMSATPPSNGDAAPLQRSREQPEQVRRRVVDRQRPRDHRRTPKGCCR